MAGGYGRGDQGSLAERVAGSARTVPAPSSTGRDRLRHRSPARHCLVDGEPGLLVEWRRGRTGWEGRVLSMAWVDASGWTTLERWLPAGEIGPAP